MRQHAADGAHVADLVVTDLAGDLGQHGQVLLDLGGVLDLDVARQRPHPELAVLEVDEAQLFDRVDVDQRRRLRQPQAHERDQAVPSRQHLGVLAVLLQQGDRLLDRAGPGVLEGGWDHRFAS